VRKFSFIVFILLWTEVFSQNTMTIVVDGETQNSNNKILLKAGYHDIIFSFPSKEKSERKYQYYLKNLEKEWKNSDFPEIRYTNLAGGYYRFFCKIIEKDFVIKKFNTEIEIKENFWEKWWFWLFIAFFVLLFISLMIYFWFLYDFRQRMKAQQIRQRIAADLHDEVGANLSSITFLVESLKKRLTGNQTNVNALLERISSNSMESVTLINDTIWALNPSFDTFEKLLERINSFASALLSSKDIAFTIENNLEEKNLDLTIEQRQNLYLIMKEAINNIAKHASATKVFLKIKKKEERIKISIEDNGVGFDTENIFEGNGLKNFQTRANTSELDVKVESKINYGTVVEILMTTKNL
jgi:Histidine kinase/Histidine kinase-, DNA gyrase B-, and HSP90-like ATPase